MGTDQDLIQRAIICLIAVMRTLLYSTLDALVCIAIHYSRLLLFDDALSVAEKDEFIPFIH